MNPGIPSGTVTFLFTDIEGSTKLWENHPELMKVDLAAHDELLRQAIEANAGYVFKTVGDAFCAASLLPQRRHRPLWISNRHSNQMCGKFPAASEYERRFMLEKLKVETMIISDPR